MEAVTIKKNSYSVKLILLSTIIIFIFIGTLFFFHLLLGKDLNHMTDQVLSEVGKQQTTNFRTRINGEIEHMQMIANLISLTPDDRLDEMKTALQTDKHDVIFSKFDISDIGNENTDYEKTVASIVGTELFSKVLAGETVFSESYRSDELGAEAVMLVSPIYRNGEISEVLCGSYSVERLDNLFVVDFFDGSGYAYITDREGHIIIKKENDFSLVGSDNLFETFSNSSFSKGSFEEIKQSMADGKCSTT